MIRDYKYMHLYNVMRKHKESLSKVAKLLNITPQTISSKLVGASEWTISEIDFLCNHYGEDYYKLFVKDE